MGETKTKKMSLAELGEAVPSDDASREAMRRLHRIEEVIDKGYGGVTLRDYIVRALEGKIKEKVPIKYSDKAR